MSEPYLIAHKVRGEPAFDIAIQMEMDDEVWWIIPTSGHRAYPWRWWKLDHFEYKSHAEIQEYDYPQPLKSVLDIPEDWPDHYEVSAAPKGQGLITDLLAHLGLKKQVKIERRI